MNQPDNKHEEKLTTEEEEAWAKSWKKGSETWLKTEKELREAEKNNNKSATTQSSNHHNKENHL